eukprot:2342363-Heterocapsa_arctica.AAC.1
MPPTVSMSSGSARRTKKEACRHQAGSRVGCSFSACVFSLRRSAQLPKWCREKPYMKGAA